MSKLKTKQAVAKRFKITAKGKVLRRRAGKSHILLTKNRKRKRRLKQQTLVKGALKEHLRQLLPYT